MIEKLNPNDWDMEKTINKINEIIDHLPQEKVSDDMNKKDGIYPNAYDDMANSKCKIDSHIPKEDGLSCECGYFTRVKQPTNLYRKEDV